MDEKYLKAKEKVEEYNQGQLLDCFDKLSRDKQEKLLDEILTLDFEEITNLYANINKEKIHESAEIGPIPFVDKEKLTDEKRNYYGNIGEELIKQGKYAVVTMAGGQGTRLGHKGPKGTFKLGDPINKSIFEILTDTMKGYKEEYGLTIPWYIMTSEDNNEHTVEFFENNNYFDYGKENVKFFKQGQLPMLNTDGKILLNEEGEIKLAADGHGGIFNCMIKQGMLYDMKQRGVEWLFISGVDNILVKPVDKILLGLAVDNHTLAGAKSLIKSYPEEKVGVFCKKNGRPSVIEYTEISKEMAEERLDNGELKYSESHILSNLFNIQVIEEMSNNKLPYHVAFKKANYMDKDGNIIVSEEPNAYKFESFLFDAFEKMDDMVILRVKREEEFAPIKNASGVDSPDTARELYLNYHENNK